MSTQEQWARLLQATAEPPPPDRDELLCSAIELGLTVAPESVGCSITEMFDGVFSTPIASGELAMALDEAQYVLNRGPCVDAARDQQSHRVDRIRSAERYPTFAAAAAKYGVLSSLSVPLPNADIPSALNLYATSDSSFDHPQQQAVAGLLAQCIGILRGVNHPSEPGERLAQAWRDHRAVADARRLLAERDGLSADGAYTALLVLARNANLTVARAADRLLSEGSQV